MNKVKDKRRTDPVTTVIPLACILALCLYFIVLPEHSTDKLAVIRSFLGDTFGTYYLVVGLGVLIVSLYIAFSKLGDIRLGRQDEKPEFSFWLWGAMVFTCGLAADHHPHCRMCNLYNVRYARYQRCSGAVLLVHVLLWRVAAVCAGVRRTVPVHD